MKQRKLRPWIIELKTKQGQIEVHFYVSESKRDREYRKFLKDNKYKNIQRKVDYKFI